jgi:CRP-like cAMP-binding protein
MIPKLFPQLLVKASRERVLAKEECLFQPQNSVDSIFYILEGELCAMRYQLDGKPAIMMRHLSGEIFAPASMSMTHYPCIGIASQISKVLQIPKIIFIEHLEKDSEFNHYYINSLATDLKKQCSSSERLRLKSAKERILHFITCESPTGKEVSLTMPMSKWAEELGLEPESLYRSLSDLEKSGTISRKKRYLKLLEPQIKN